MSSAPAVNTSRTSDVAGDVVTTTIGQLGRSRAASATYASATSGWPLQATSIASIWRSAVAVGELAVRLEDLDDLDAGVAEHALERAPVDGAVDRDERLDRSRRHHSVPSPVMVTVPPSSVSFEVTVSSNCLSESWLTL